MRVMNILYICLPPSLPNLISLTILHSYPFTRGLFAMKMLVYLTKQRCPGELRRGDTQGFQGLNTRLRAVPRTTQDYSRCRAQHYGHKACAKGPTSKNIRSFFRNRVPLYLDLEWSNSDENLMQKLLKGEWFFMKIHLHSVFVTKGINTPWSSTSSKVKTKFYVSNPFLYNFLISK